MFCVLRVIKRENTLFERLFGRFLKDDYSIKTVPVLKGAPFFLLTATVGKNGIDWERVQSAAGKCAGRLIAEENIVLPETLNIGSFKSHMLKNKMTENTFARILKSNGLEKSPRSIKIIDSRALHADFILKIAPFSEKLTVITQNRERYMKICSDIMAECGLSVMFVSEPGGEKITLDLDNMRMKIKCAGGEMKIQAGDEFTVPPIYSDLLPPNINKHDFYSALYELCGVFSLGECIFDEVNVNNEKKSVGSVRFS